jgi:hypothetical protein
MAEHEQLCTPLVDEMYTAHILDGVVPTTKDAFDI